MTRRLRAALALAAAVTAPALPAWAIATALHPRWRADWRARWGLEVAPIEPGALWVHASSVGEQRAVAALLPHLERPVLITADTDTGAERARALAAAAGPGVVGCARPIDHPWTIAPLWAEARPRGVVLIESAWWPQLVARALHAGVPVVRASAKAGRGSRRWGPVWRALGDGVVARAAEDLKPDAPVPPSPLRWERPFIVGASLRASDEVPLLAAWRALPPPRPALLLAPRRLDRVHALVTALEASGTRWARRSALSDGVVPTDAEVVVLDTLGELAGCLRGASAAYIGGALDPRIGGHSPAEALAAGVPVIAGPYVHANAAAFAHPAVERVPAEDLGAALRRAIARPGPPPGGTGAAARAAAGLARHLDGPPAPEASPRPWAVPLVPVVRVGGRARARWRARHGPVWLAIPVVAIGSPNARGPGKSSTVRWMARALAARGHRVGVVVRGYRRALPDGMGRSWEGDGVARLGDEGALCASDGHLVAAGADRVAAARALQRAGATVVVVDDGLDEARLRADLRLLVLDARFPGARGALPVGERRPLDGGHDGVVVHHAEHRAALALPDGAVVARREVGPWRRGGAQVDAPSGRVAALLGVARPADALARLGVRVDRAWVLRDHQPVSDALAARVRAWAGELPLVCTAKDHVRLPEPLRSEVWVQDLHLVLDDVPARWLDLTPRRGAGGRATR